jgi:hypothetical protein
MAGVAAKDDEPQGGGLAADRLRSLSERIVTTAAIAGFGRQ